MRKFIFILLTAALALSVDAVADTAGSATAKTRLTKSKKCQFPQSKKRAPEWVCHAQSGALALAAVGSAAKSGAGMAFMQQMAAADARVNLARKLHDPLQKQLAASTGTANSHNAGRDHALISRITDEQLQGSRILKSAYGPKGRLYVLMGFDEAGARQLQESITADYLKQQR